MDTRFIDWKHSARHRRLLSREFRQERNHRIMLGFDTGRLMLESVDGLPRLDHAIRAGLLLAWVSLGAGDLPAPAALTPRSVIFSLRSAARPSSRAFSGFPPGSTTARKKQTSPSAWRS